MTEQLTDILKLVITSLVFVLQVMDECLSLGNRGRWTDWFDSTPSDANIYKGVTYEQSKPETQ